MRGSAVLTPVVRAVRWLDHAAGRLAGRRTVLVEVRTPMNLAVLKPVLEPLRQDRRVRLLFTGPDRADLRAAFAEQGLEGSVIPRERATWRRVDLYINADPWEAVSLRRAARQLNFFHGVAGKYNLDCPADLPIGFERYDRVAFPNEGRRDAYVAAGIVRAERAALIGYPKADVLVTDGGNPRQQAAALGLDAARPTAIFAPTFSPASALHHAGDAIIETLLASGCNVIAKLHDRSLDLDRKYSAGVNWRERLARFAGPAFLLAGSGDSTAFVLASDLMVTDHSSIGFEFCALDRPLVVYDAPGLIETARINVEKVQLLRSAARVVHTPAELAEAVRASLAAPGTTSAERRRAAAEVFYRPGGATARALRLVYDLLALKPAADAVTTRASVRPAPSA
jgi:hypothetical protein